MSRLRIASPAEFATALQAEIEALHQFITILESEQDALTEGNIDKLYEISRQKSEQVIRLSQLSASHFSNQNIANDTPEEIALIFQKADPDGKFALTQRWEKLSALANEAKHLNQLNGVMIETQLKHNQQALSILQEAAMQNSLYGPDGQYRRKHPPRR